MNVYKVAYDMEIIKTLKNSLVIDLGGYYVIRAWLMGIIGFLGLINFKHGLCCVVTYARTSNITSFGWWEYCSENFFDNHMIRFKWFY